MMSSMVYNAVMKRTRQIILYVVWGFAILLPYVGFFVVRNWYSNKVDEIKYARFIVVDKTQMTLTLYDYKGNNLMCVPMACGKAYGNKQQRGDMKTPEGIFRVESIEDASNWTHDFGDGLGEVEGAYGSVFIRLACPGHKGIGIHGTHLPESLGTRSSEGCIRIENADIIQLAKQVHPGMVVAILPSVEDAIENEKVITK